MTNSLRILAVGAAALAVALGLAWWAERSQPDRRQQAKQAQRERVNKAVRALIGEWESQGEILWEGREQKICLLFTPQGHLLVDDGTRLAAASYRLLPSGHGGSGFVLQVENQAGSARLELVSHRTNGSEGVCSVRRWDLDQRDPLAVSSLAELASSGRRLQRRILQPEGLEQSFSEPKYQEPDLAKLGSVLTTLRLSLAAMHVQLSLFHRDRQSLTEHIGQLPHSSLEDLKQHPQGTILVEELAELIQQLDALEQAIRQTETRLTEVESLLRRSRRQILLALTSPQTPDLTELQAIIEAVRNFEDPSSQGVIPLNSKNPPATELLLQQELGLKPQG